MECTEKMRNTSMKINKTEMNLKALMNEIAINRNHLSVTMLQSVWPSKFNCKNI